MLVWRAITAEIRMDPVCRGVIQQVHEDGNIVRYHHAQVSSGTEL